MSNGTAETIFQRLRMAPILIIVALIAVVAWSVHASNQAKRVRQETLEKQQVAFDDVCVHLIRNGMTYDEIELVSDGLAQKRPELLPVFLDLKVVRESIDLALQSKDERIATARMNLAEDRADQLASGEVGHVSPHVAETVREAVRTARQRFGTAQFLNSARGHVEKADKLKTQKAQRRHLTLAVEVLNRGITEGSGDEHELRQALALIESRLSS